MSFFVRPGNMSFSAVKTAPDNTMLSLSNDQMSLTSIADTPYVANIKSVTKTAYSAGVLKVMTVTFANDSDWSTTKAYEIHIVPEYLDTYPEEVYTFIPAAATAASAAAAFNAAVLAKAGVSIVTTGVSSAVVTLTQVSLYSGNFQGLTVIGTGTAADIVYLADGTGGTTAYVRPSGTLTEIALYDTTVSSGTYDKWIVNYNKPTTLSPIGKTVFVDSSIVYWVNTAGTNYAAFNSKMLQWYGKLVSGAQGFVHGRTAAAINSTATATAAQVAGGYITSTSAAATTITLPTATLLAAQLNAVAGDTFDFVLDNTAGASTVTIAVGSGIVASDFPGTNTLTRTASATVGIAVFKITFISTTAAILARIS